MRILRRQVGNLSLRTKGLVAVALPVLVVLVFVTLSAREGSARSRTASGAVRADVALRGALRTVEAGLSSADAEVLTMVSTGPEARPEFNRHMADAETALRRFDDLPASTPARVRVDASVRASLVGLQKVADLAAQEPSEAFTQPLLALDALLDATRERFQAEWALSQRRLNQALATSDRTVSRGFARVTLLLLLGGVGGVALGFVMFLAGVSRRIRSVGDNADRLIVGEALVPSRGGHDEVDRLARRLEEAAALLAARRAELAASESKYRSIVETAREGVWTIDAEGVTTFANARMGEILGLSPEELVGRSPMEFMDEAGREQFMTTVATLERGVPAQVEGMLRHRDGSAVWALCETSSFVDAAGVFAGALAMVTDITERQRLNDELEFHALHDALTGLPNRRLFLDLLQGYADEADGRRRAVVLIDLDRFKVVNDSLGHAVGDTVLRGVAERLSTAVRTGDVVARLGGDEFVVLCSVAGPDDALRIANRLLEAIDQPVVVEGRCVQLSASAGVAVYEGGTGRPDDLVRDADVAMYAAKRQGPGRAQLFSEALGEDAVSKLQVESDLRSAIANGELTLHYQPQVSLITEEVVGVEALVRWNHPTRGLVPPNEFIPVAEETGLIVPLGTWVLTEACRQAAAWVRAVPALAVPVSVNVSSHQLAHSDVAALTSAILRDAQLEAKWLTLEVTESALMTDPEAAAATLADLHALGVGVSIDDFGTGYSSLAYLQRFPVDALKVDRTFVKGLGTEVDESAIVTAVVALSKALVLSTVAEGVETPEQRSRLLSLGCEIGQGFLWSKPVPSAELERWVTERQLSPVGHVAPGQAGSGAFRALIVDDVAAHRAAVSRMLGRSAWFDVVGEASDGEDAISACARLRPDLVVLDVSMPGMSGLEALPRILEQAPDTKVVLLSGVVGPEDAAQSVADGAAAFLRKGLTSKRLVDELMEVMAG